MEHCLPAIILASSYPAAVRTFLLLILTLSYSARYLTSNMPKFFLIMASLHKEMPFGCIVYGCFKTTGLYKIRYYGDLRQEAFKRRKRWVDFFSNKNVPNGSRLQKAWCVQNILKWMNFHAPSISRGYKNALLID